MVDTRGMFKDWVPNKTFTQMKGFIAAFHAGSLVRNRERFV